MKEAFSFFQEQWLTNWLMLGVTIIYVISTILICRYNKKSANVSYKQLRESQNQFEETRRISAMPFLQLEVGSNNEGTDFDMELNQESESRVVKVDAKIRIKNVGNGTATNIIYSWRFNDLTESEYGFPPINAVMRGDSYLAGIRIYLHENCIERNASLQLQYEDLLGNTYEQNVCVVFDGFKIERIENNTPILQGEIKYYATELKE